MNIESPNRSSFRSAHTIDDAVRYTLHAVDGDKPCDETALTADELEWMQKERSYWSFEQKYLRGVFAGGTFCYQAQQIFRDAGISIYSNAPLESKYKLTDSDCSLQHTIAIWDLTNIQLADPIR